MAFVQTIEFTTSKFDELRESVRAWEAATAGRRKTVRRIITRDRDQPDHYVIVVLFDSYEEAMANSDLPETAGLAAELAALADAPPTFANLDVIEDNPD